MQGRGGRFESAIPILQAAGPGQGNPSLNGTGDNWKTVDLHRAETRTPRHLGREEFSAGSINELASTRCFVPHLTSLFREAPVSPMFLDRVYCFFFCRRSLQESSSRCTTFLPPTTRIRRSRT